jgi:hypothetical protein
VRFARGKRCPCALFFNAEIIPQVNGVGQCVWKRQSGVGKQPASFKVPKLEFGPIPFIEHGTDRSFLRGIIAWAVSVFRKAVREIVITPKVNAIGFRKAFLQPYCRTACVIVMVMKLVEIVPEKDSKVGFLSFDSLINLFEVWSVVNISEIDFAIPWMRSYF